MLPLDEGTVERIAAGEPDWMQARRAAGMERFTTMGMPTPQEEVWRYVDLDFDLDDFALAEEPGAPLAADGAVLDALGDLAGAATIVDGAVVGSSTDAGAVFLPSADAVREHEAVLRSAYGKGIDAGLDRFAAAHHAFGRGGMFLYVPKGMAVEAPYLVDIQATVPETVSFPRLTIVVEPGAEARVVVHYNSPRRQRHLVVPQIEADVHDDGRLRLSFLQEFAYDTIVISQVRMVAGRDSGLRLGEVGLGGSLARLHLTMELLGPGSRGEVAGLYFGEQEQVLDYRAFMRHAAPNTSSDIFLKGAVEDEADSVFTGLIRIEHEAQKTDAFQTNRNLVLSDGAEAQSVPNLEILANDVRCGHGSTVGPLDPEQRHYLMSRGLDRTRADRLQVRGFFEEAVQRLPEPSLADPVRRRVNGKFVAAQREGRV